MQLPVKHIVVEQIWQVEQVVNMCMGNKRSVNLVRVNQFLPDTVENPPGVFWIDTHSQRYTHKALSGIKRISDDCFVLMGNNHSATSGVHEVGRMGAL